MPGYQVFAKKVFFSGWLVELTLVKCVSDNIAGVALVSVSLSNKPHVVLISNIFIFYQLELLDRRSWKWARLESAGLMPVKCKSRSFFWRISHIFSLGYFIFWAKWNLPNTSTKNADISIWSLHTKFHYLTRKCPADEIFKLNMIFLYTYIYVVHLSNRCTLINFARITWTNQPSCILKKVENLWWETLGRCKLDNSVLSENAKTLIELSFVNGECTMGGGVSKFFFICGDFKNAKTKNNQFRLLFHWWVQKGSHEYSKRRCALKCPTEQARISSLWSFTWGHILVMELQRRLRGGNVCWSIYRKGRFLSWWFLGEVN